MTVLADRIVAAPTEEEIMILAREAATAIDAGDHVAQFFAVGHGVHVIRRRAMAKAGSNQPRGQKYSRAFADLLDGEPAIKAVFDSRAITDVLWCVENEAVVLEIIADMPEKLRRNLNPGTLRRAAFDLIKSRSNASAKPARASVKDQLADAFKERDEEHALRVAAEDEVRTLREGFNAISLEKVDVEGWTSVLKSVPYETIKAVMTACKVALGEIAPPTRVVRKVKVKLPKDASARQRQAQERRERLEAIKAQRELAAYSPATAEQE